MTRAGIMSSTPLGIRATSPGTMCSPTGQAMGSRSTSTCSGTGLGEESRPLKYEFLSSILYTLSQNAEDGGEGKGRAALGVGEGAEPVQVTQPSAGDVESCNDIDCHLPLSYGLMSLFRIQVQNDASPSPSAPVIAATVQIHRSSSPGSSAKSQVITITE